jgi:predicted enzyme related to lactoylglutathione lyase
MPHPVVRWQIVSPDAEATASFYRKLFEWEPDTANALGFREIRPGGGGIDGGVWPAANADRPFVQLFVEVPNVEEHLSRATALGARVLVPTSVLPDGDAMAVLLDPLGMPFGICALAHH